MNNSTGAERPSTAVEDFTAYFASITNERERERLLTQIKMRAVQDAPDEAFAPVGRSAADLLRDIPKEPDWLIPGVMARTWLVKFAAREKTGKGTLIAYLLGCLERGEPTVFGAATEPVTALIYTEEPPDSLREKIASAALEKAWIIYGYELAQLDWTAKINRLIRIATDGGHSVLFVDNISRAAAVEDEAGVELARRAEELGEAAKAAGLTTIIDHHHKKGAGRLADKSRGGTALAGACDNNLEMQHSGDWDSRVRKLSSRGRLSLTIWEATIALSADGKTYESVAGTTQPQTVRERQRLRILSEAGDTGLTAKQFEDAANVSNDTARRVLGEFVAKGWATEDATAFPTHWAATGEGLDGVPDLLDSDYLTTEDE